MKHEKAPEIPARSEDGRRFENLCHHRGLGLASPNRSTEMGSRTETAPAAPSPEPGASSPASGVPDKMQWSTQERCWFGYFHSSKRWRALEYEQLPFRPSVSDKVSGRSIRVPPTCRPTEVAPIARSGLVGVPTSFRVREIMDEK